MPTTTSALSISQVRRMVLDAQGLTAPRPKGRIDRRHLRRVTDRFGVVQLDSVNVLARAHLLPFFTRLGPVDPAAIDRMAYDDHELFEYWAHEACLVRADLHPLLRWRMRQGTWRGGKARDDLDELMDRIETVVLAEGPLSAAEVADAVGESKKKAGPWWGWGPAKTAVERLFQRGRLGTLRRGNFERVYCAPGMAVPSEVLGRPTPSRQEAVRALTAICVAAHGVVVPADVGDYWRLKLVEVRPALAELVAEGTIEQVEVQGWREPAFVTAGANVPRRRSPGVLVNPFDPGMWCRPRLERVHDFAYKIEIYVPEPQRRYGYYSLPFLLGETYVGRVDLKADRAGRRLLVRSAWQEPDLAQRGTDEGAVADALAEELRVLASWLDLDDITVETRGDLAPLLTHTIGATP